MGLPVGTTIQNKSKTFDMHLLCPKSCFQSWIRRSCFQSPDKKSASLGKKCEGRLIKVYYFIEFVSKREIQMV